MSEGNGIESKSNVDKRELQTLVGDEDVLLVLAIHDHLDNANPYLRLELSCPSNINFLMYFNLTKEAYQQLTNEQKLSIPFETFSKDLFAIIDKICTVQQTKETTFGGLFTFSISLQNDSSHFENGKVLSIIQHSSFITFPLISIPFYPASNDEFSQYLITILKAYQEQFGECPIYSSSSTNIVTNYKQLQEKYDHDIQELKENNKKSLDELKSTLEKQIESLNQQLNTVDAEHTSTLDSQREQWLNQLEALQTKLTASSNELLALRNERDELNETVNSMKAHVDEVNKRLEEGTKNSTELQRALANEEELKGKVVELQNQLDANIVLNEQYATRLQQNINTINDQKKTIETLNSQLKDSNSSFTKSQSTLKENEETIKSLSVQIAKLKTENGTMSENIKNLDHANKMKDRAITCLNVEINKMKLGSHYSTF